jgi:hypothetical protein
MGPPTLNSAGDDGAADAESAGDDGATKVESTGLKVYDDSGTDARAPGYIMCGIDVECRDVWCNGGWDGR